VKRWQCGAYAVADWSPNWLIVSHALQVKINAYCNLLRDVSLLCVMIQVHRIKKVMNLCEVLLWFIFKDCDSAQAYEDNKSDISARKSDHCIEFCNIIQ